MVRAAEIAPEPAELAATGDPDPYEEVWALPGFTAGDNFMGLRFLDPEKSEVVVEGLRIDPLSKHRCRPITFGGSGKSARSATIWLTRCTVTPRIGAMSTWRR